MERKGERSSRMLFWMGWAMFEYEDATIIPRSPKYVGEEFSIRTPGLAMKMLSKNMPHFSMLPYQS